MTIFKNKKFILVLVFLLILLILPRIAVYSMFGKGMVSTDAEQRYFPQVKELSESLTNLFHQNGPFYSLFLFLFEKINVDMVAGPVFVQHILGIITALLVFFYFRKVNLILAFFVAVFTYSSWVSLWIEHTILRDSLAAFLLVSLITLISLSAKKVKYFNFYFALLSGSIITILTFTRIEFGALLVLMPLILFILKKREFPDFKIRDKAFFKWNVGYLLPVFVFLILKITVPSQAPESKTSYDSFFRIAYLNLIPEAFYYDGSDYPELLKEYQKVLETSGNKFESNDKNREVIGKFHEVTEKYLSEHPETSLSMLQIMDKVYIEIMTKNTLVYSKSFLINVKNQILGISELQSLITKYKLSESSRVDRALRDYNIGMVWFSILLFWLSLISLPFLFIKWKTLPLELVISFFVSFVQVGVLALLADANHRFKYPIDPFIYFLQFSLIIFMLEAVFINFKKHIINKNNSDK